MTEVKTICGLAVALALLAGCAPAVDTSDSMTGSGIAKKHEFKAQALAGLPIDAVKDDPAAFKSLVVSNSSRWGYQRDAFALTPEEKRIDLQQAAERLVSTSGGFSVEYTPPEPVDTAPVYVEPQPYRRLSGIIVGDSVIALLEMGDGRPSSEIVRPGYKVPNSPWTVAAIDENKATLVRGGSTLPKQIIVRLETPPGGVTTTGTGSSFGNMGNFRGNMPGNIPGMGSFPGSGRGLPGSGRGSIGGKGGGMGD